MAIRAWVVPAKGADVDGAADCAIEGVHALGHRGPVSLKTDNEPALIALREAIMTKMLEGAIPIQPTPGESASNGGVETGVKVFKGLLRVHLAALERNLGARLPSSRPLFSWIVEHVSDVLTEYLVGTDGRSAYGRLCGKPNREEGSESRSSTRSGTPTT